MDSKEAVTEKSVSEQIRERIEYVLGIYPKLSRSMLQVGIGTSLHPSMWKPVLNDMIEDGTIIVKRRPSTNPQGRNLQHEILSLARQPDPVDEDVA
jgi:hypothetical protein